MPENALIIRHQGKEYDFELTETQASTLRKFIIVAGDIPPAPEILPESRQQERGRSLKVYEDSANLNDMIPIITDLDKIDLIRLNAFLSVLTAGSAGEEGRNWIFETIDTLLFHVRAEGPFAANEIDPREALVGLAGDIENFWYWINEAKSMLENHPNLCPAPPAEPEAVPEPATTSTKPKRQRARHAKRKAA